MSVTSAEEGYRWSFDHSHPRAELPFHHIVIDCIGPIDPSSSKKHKYCLCVMDNCTRWPEVYPLRTLKASEIFDNLLQLFMQMGVASVISSDNGSNFINASTQEFESVWVVRRGLTHLTIRKPQV